MEGADKAQDKLLVRGITASGFRISGQIYDQPLLLYGAHIYDWPHASLTQAGALLLLGQLAPPPAYLLMGTGARTQPVAPDLVHALKAVGIGVEAMDSRSAVRTYNILVLEGRSVALALLPPDR